MKKFKLGPMFYIYLVIAMISAALLLVVVNQEDNIDFACDAIYNFENQQAKAYVDEIKNLDGIGSRKETVLMASCSAGNTEMILYVLARGASPNYTLSGALTPLELLCRDGYLAGPQAIKHLLKYGARQSIFSEKPALFFLAESFTKLTASQKKDVSDAAIVLLQNGSPLGYGEDNILHYAAMGDMADLFDLVVHTTQGLYMINDKNSDGLTPWALSVKYGAVKVQQVIRNLEQEAYDQNNQDQDQNQDQNQAQEEQSSTNE